MIVKAEEDVNDAERWDGRLLLHCNGMAEERKVRVFVLYMNSGGW